MSDIMISLVSSDDQASTNIQPGMGNKKHKEFLRKRRFLERKGYLKDKQNKFKHKKAQSTQGPSHHSPVSQENGTKHPPPPTVTQAQKSLHASKSSSSVVCSSRPSVSTKSPATLTVTVLNSSYPRQSIKPATKGTSAPRSLKPTACVSSGSSPIGKPEKYLAIDCEMVGTGPQGRVSQLARCSIVSYEGDVVYDKFIKPTMPVTDYRTRWSGIRPRDLAMAPPYIDARKEILRLLTGKVVIGHAIHHDLKVLGYFHPSSLIRDTSKIPLLNRKAGFGETECVSLKRLTKAIFNRDIQTGKQGHSSVEDAQATMQLYKVVEEEWERTLASKGQARC
ncbi:interferon-stimulated 20 kDa exonuclease-like 2 [Lampris incognitus]|uniref:interferon-stimulated 20 kDa exonuclease-like 2 n=1 Tax=Lampris incognitus TaxID=2546036 RepID=UPI0024B4F82F|nr:interferon-stimulated 20 kDa exonuclease-like 2 [Lampris incognitus]XP_056141744.1 interferon-stimulated 20 kDa exonuclease-like 2 [Lampris incognitus]XP_056141745.1 interferon-stimulated 20 kDa exonuclease-like 2 [Lampris incognitus]